MSSTLFINGKIWPGTSDAAIESAMVIDGSKIVAVGEAALSMATDTTGD